jgi:hypothetical protein
MYKREDMEALTGYVTAFNEAWGALQGLTNALDKGLPTWFRGPGEALAELAEGYTALAARFA